MSKQKVCCIFGDFIVNNRFYYDLLIALAASGEWQCVAHLRNRKADMLTGEAVITGTCSLAKALSRQPDIECAESLEAALQFADVIVLATDIVETKKLVLKANKEFIEAMSEALIITAVPLFSLEVAMLISGENAESRVIRMLITGPIAVGAAAAYYTGDSKLSPVYQSRLRAIMSATQEWNELPEKLIPVSRAIESVSTSEPMRVILDSTISIGQKLPYLNMITLAVFRLTGELLDAYARHLPIEQVIDGSFRWNDWAAKHGYNVGELDRFTEKVRIETKKYQDLPIT